MLCPVHGTKMPVMETRTFDDGTVRRRYHCAECSKYYTGVEELVPEMDGSVGVYYETRAAYGSAMFFTGKRAMFQRMEQLFKEEVDRIDNELKTES